MIELRNVTRRLPSGEKMLTILDDVSLTVQSGEFASIVGPSGSGKTTLLGLMAGLDRPSAGTIVVAGTSYDSLSEDDLASFRGANIGFIFQAFHLISNLTALENVQVPLELLGHPRAAERAEEVLQLVGLSARSGHYPVQLSGGEQQRVAIARAFAPRPPILLADEPTGNLDSVTGGRVMDLLLSLHGEHDTTLILVTHEQPLADRADRAIRLEDGRLTQG